MLYQKIKDDLNKATINKDQLLVDVLRLMISEIRYEEIRLRGQGKEITDQDVIGVLTKESKKRKESIEMFESAGRDDLVNREKAELELIQTYLPAQLSQDQIKQTIQQVIKKQGDQANFGSVMKETMSELKGQADGKIVSELVKQALG